TLEGRAVTLPRNGVVGGLPKRQFTLTTTATLDPAQRGKPLTLIVECFHGELELRIDGKPVADIGEVMVGEHRFLISAEQSARGRIDFALDTRGDPISYGFVRAQPAERALHRRDRGPARCYRSAHRRRRSEQAKPRLAE